MRKRMKKKLLYFITCLFITFYVTAQNELYWVGGATGNWHDVDSWSTALSGGAVGNWIDGSIAVFAQEGGGTINLPNAVDALYSIGGLKFEKEGYKITGSGGTYGFLTIHESVSNLEIYVEENVSFILS